jgi:hypothetical protein
VRLLDSSGGGRRFAGSLGGELLSWGFASSWLSCGLLGSGDFLNFTYRDWAEKMCLVFILVISFKLNN